jgi:hypothetical protein
LSPEKSSIAGCAQEPGGGIEHSDMASGLRGLQSGQTPGSAAAIGAAVNNAHAATTKIALRYRIFGS